MAMAMQLRCSTHQHHLFMVTSPLQTPSLPCSSSTLLQRKFFNHKSKGNQSWNSLKQRLSKHRFLVSASSSSSNTANPLWDAWKPDDKSSSPPLSDVLWPAAGAFAAMAILGKVDQMLAPKGISMTIAPLGAVCAVLFAAPSSPAAKKYNMFMAQIACAAFGVVAFLAFGPGWLARSAALAASIAFMIYTRTMHPPAASLPILFIDAAKLHQLNFWYALFPGAAGCILLCLIQEIVCYLKDNFKF